MRAVESDAGAYRREYSAGVIREIARWVLEDSVSVPSEAQRPLRVAWDCKIWVIEEIVGLRSKRDLHAFRHLETLLQREINLSESRPRRILRPAFPN